MKKVVGLVVLFLGFAFVSPVQAEETKTIAIIDTAIDSSKNPSIIYEACFTLRTCPNNVVIKNPVTRASYSFQEGPGSANVSETDWKVKGIDHGHNMVQVALLANPNIKIVFVRISDPKTYAGFSLVHNDGQSLDLAIDWVSKNAKRFNISAVSVSQSRSNFAPGKCPIAPVFSNAVNVLNQNNVPVFVASGNDSKKTQVGFPACVPGVVAVGALRPNLIFASYTNIGPELDLVAPGGANIKALGGWDITVTGTSVATPTAAVLSITNKQTMSITEYFATLPKAVDLPYISK